MEAYYREFRISAIYKGDKAARFDARNTNRHVVWITNMLTGKRTSFEFWTSLAQPKMKDDRDVLDAFDCFISDGMAAIGSFEDFCMDFGYDTDSRRAYGIYQACRRSREKLERITGLEGDELYDFVNGFEGAYNR